MSDHHPDEIWIARAIDLATQNVSAGGGPFGAVIVRDGGLIAEGQNRVTATLDPTARVVKLPRAPGAREARWAHLLSGEPAPLDHH